MSRRGSCCRWLLLGTRSHRVAVSGQCLCVGICCCILDDSEVRVSEFNDKGFGSNMSELSTSASSSDEAWATDSFVSSLYSGSCGSSQTVDDAQPMFGVPSPEPKIGCSTDSRKFTTSWAPNVDSELPCRVRQKLGIAVTSHTRLAAVDHNEGCPGMPRSRSCQHLSRSCHRDNDTDIPIGPAGTRRHEEDRTLERTVHNKLLESCHDEGMARQHEEDWTPEDERNNMFVAWQGLGSSASTSAAKGSELRLQWL